MLLSFSPIHPSWNPVALCLYIYSVGPGLCWSSHLFPPPSLSYSHAQSERQLILFFKILKSSSVLLESNDAVVDSCSCSSPSTPFLR